MGSGSIAARHQFASPSRVILDRRSTLNSPRAKFLDRVLPTPNRQFIIGSGSEETTVWKVDVEARIASVDHGATGQAIAVSRDGTLVAIAGFEQRGEATDEIRCTGRFPQLAYR